MTHAVLYCFAEFDLFKELFIRLEILDINYKICVCFDQHQELYFDVSPKGTSFGAPPKGTSFGARLGQFLRVQSA